MNSITAMVTGAGLGCLAMYELDPERGSRRRAQAREKIGKIQRKAGDAAAVTARDLRNRTLGTLAEGRSWLSERGVSDETLRERVRSELGFLVRYPSFIDVQVENSAVTLTGRAFTDECEQLIEGVRSMRGVGGVENRLDAYDRPENFPGLEGQPPKPKPTGRPFDLMRQHWSPATRLLVGVAALVGLSVIVFSLREGEDGSYEQRSRLAEELRR